MINWWESFEPKIRVVATEDFSPLNTTTFLFLSYVLYGEKQKCGKANNQSFNPQNAPVLREVYKKQQGVFAFFCEETAFSAYGPIYHYIISLFLSCTSPQTFLSVSIRLHLCDYRDRVEQPSGYTSATEQLPKCI